MTDYMIIIGDEIAAGEDAPTGSGYCQHTANRLGYAIRQYTQTNASFANMVVTLTNNAVSGTSSIASQVKQVVIAAGIHDTLSTLSTAQSKTKTAITTAKSAWPNARIMVAIGAGSAVGMSNTAMDQQSTCLSAIRMTAREQGADVVMLRAVCGKDTTMQSSGVKPDQLGHEMLAQELYEAICEARGSWPDEDTGTVKHQYKSGLTDYFSTQVAATRKREEEKREANRPTGTEIAGVTEKLDELTQTQGVQQYLLEQQQNTLEQVQAKQGDEIKRVDAVVKTQGEEQAKLKTVQDQLKKAQDQLATVVGNQGDQVTSLQSVTATLNNAVSRLTTLEDKNTTARIAIINIESFLEKKYPNEFQSYYS